MKCANCGKLFEPKAVNQKFCSRRCERQNAYSNYINRTAPTTIPDARRPIAEFICKNCGKSVFIYDRSDQRFAYCCGKCAVKYRNKLAQNRNAKKHGDNIGISSGMSLGSLIRRERRDLA